MTLKLLCVSIIASASFFLGGVYMKISDIDKNLAVQTTIDDKDFIYFDVRNEPFKIYGVIPADDEYDFYRRIPDDVAKATNDGVYGLNHHTAGGRIRFITDSPKVAMHTRQSFLSHFSHMPTTGHAGFDVFVTDENGEERHHATLTPPVDIKDGYDSWFNLGGGLKTVTINMPLYGGVNEILIGLKEGATLLPAPEYEHTKPIVYYGSSITQGGCASRPGNSYEAILSRELSADHINLGFSGSGRGEQAIADYIASLDMSVFVLDYDHNAPDPKHLEATHENFFKTVRTKHPEMPIIMMSRPKLHLNEEEKQRLEVIRTTYKNALNAGDKNVYLIEGTEFFDSFGGECATVDGCHPNDFGFVCMAEHLKPLLEALLEK